MSFPIRFIDTEAKVRTILNTLFTLLFLYSLTLYSRVLYKRHLNYLSLFSRHTVSLLLGILQAALGFIATASFLARRTAVPIASCTFNMVLVFLLLHLGFACITGILIHQMLQAYSLFYHRRLFTAVFLEVVRWVAWLYTLAKLKIPDDSSQRCFAYSFDRDQVLWISITSIALNIVLGIFFIGPLIGPLKAVGIGGSLRSIIVNRLLIMLLACIINVAGAVLIIIGLLARNEIIVYMFEWALISAMLVKLSEKLDDAEQLPEE